MKRFLIPFLLFIISLSISDLSHASNLPPNLQEMTNDAELIIEGKCTAISKGEDIKVSSHLSRPTQIFKFKVDQIIKNENDIEISAGSDFSFSHFISNRKIASVNIISEGEDYTIYLKKYKKFDVWRFAGGGYGIFKVEKGASGKKMAINRYDNKGLMAGMKKTVGSKKIKAATDQEIPAINREVFDHIRGPIELDKMIDVTKRIQLIKKIREIPKTTPFLEIKEGSSN